jgi:hypothetical protein
LKLATIADFMSGRSARAESEIATSQQGAEGASFAVECTVLLPALASTPVLLSASPSSSEPPPKPKENFETSAMLPVQENRAGRRVQARVEAATLKIGRGLGNGRTETLRKRRMFAGSTGLDFRIKMVMVMVDV